MHRLRKVQEKVGKWWWAVGGPVAQTKKGAGKGRQWEAQLHRLRQVQRKVGKWRWAVGGQAAQARINAEKGR